VLRKSGGKASEFVIFHRARAAARGRPHRPASRLVWERIFTEAPGDLDNYLRADAPTRKTLWRAQTQHLKLSTFAEEYFRRIGTAMATPMLLRKGNLHELVESCDAADLKGEVKEKLDEILKILG